MTKSRPALEFKGRMLSITRVRILDENPTAIEAQLKTFTRSLGEAAEGLPLLLDAESPVGLKPILAAMRAVGVQPIAVVEGPLSEAARECGLAILTRDMISDGAPRASAPVESVRAAPAPAATPVAPAERRPARVVTEPIRSGQQIYAEASDLIVMTTVSPGAEVIADGCVHVYGPLRGRAIAGARGDVHARVFCRRMEAELMAVAGIYAVADQMKGALRGVAVQAYLKHGVLTIDKLDW
ncbi:septum site-determining protein MinC [Panacagrimonas perspica]|uniref:Probable septum site-determining protein MinC n=1 Tax=Panacagrimonas perspica TaxID=381431 RepID=A0A4S3K8P1_9GAMM|nr:septum site-determining protein MinC [Panacagrimonas perspica]TDU24224.1 septum site-determining protein MinC [Panacagrimonas perspica]THD04633.1 septum site-determining protein MinC [Panacagrimonas perspica]